MTDWVDHVRAASPGNLSALSGLQTIDGISLIAGDRVLLKDQLAQSQNGLYSVAPGAWTRTADAIAPELVVRVSEGAINAHSEWVLITQGSITVGTTALSFVNVSASVSVRQFGATGDAQTVGDGVMTAASPTLSCTTSAPFSASDVGKTVLVYGAGASSPPSPHPALIATISAFVDSSTVTLSDSAGTSVSSALVSFGSDDALAFQSALDQCAMTGVSLFIPPGRYLLAAQLVLPSHVVVIGSPAAVLVGALPRESHSANLLYASWTTDAFSAGLTADIAQWAHSCVLDAAPTVGSQIWVRSTSSSGSEYSGIYSVAAVTGSGSAYTVSVDRPFVLPYAATGAEVRGISARPTDIQVFGNGMTITGNATRHLELLGGVRCVFRDMVFDSSGGSPGIAMSLDLACDHCWGIRLHVRTTVQADGQPTYGLITESSENCGYQDCSATGVYSDGLAASDAAFFRFDNCESVGIGPYPTHSALVIHSNGLAKCVSCQITGGAYWNFSAVGILIDSAEDTMLEGLAAQSGQGSASSSVTLSAAAIGTSIVGCALGRSTYGVYVSEGASGTRVVACSIRDTRVGVYAGSSSPVDVADCHIQSVSNNGTIGGSVGVMAYAGGQARIRGTTIVLDNPKAAWPNGGYVWGNHSALQISHSRIVLAARDATYGMYGVQVDGSGSANPKAYVENLVVEGAVAGAANSYGLIMGAAGATIRIGTNVDLDACNVRTSFAPGSYASRGGQMTASGTGATQTVTWPDITSTDRLQFRLLSKAGTPTPYPPIYTITPGSQFGVTFAAGDTSTYEYMID